MAFVLSLLFPHLSFVVSLEGCASYVSLLWRFLCIHYENMPIQIYRKFHLKKTEKKKKSDKKH